MSAQGIERIAVLQALTVNIWLNYPEQAMAYAQEALELSLQQNDSASISSSLRYIAGVHYYQGNFSQSLDYNLKALDIAMGIPDSTMISNGFSNIGLLYNNLGSYQTALEYLLKSERIKQKIDQTYGLAATLNNIGLVYLRTENMASALQYFRRALATSIDLQEPNQEVYSLNNIATAYLQANEYTSADSLFRIAQKLAEDLENTNWCAVSLRGIARILIEQDQLDSAEWYVKQSLDLCTEINDKQGIAESYYLLAKHQQAGGNFSTAMQFLNASHSWARQISLRHQMLKNLRLYSAIYTDLGDSDQVIMYQDRYIFLKDSLFKDVVGRNLALLPQKIKDEEEHITFASQKSAFEKQNYINRVYGILLTLTIPLIAVLIFLLKKNSDANKELRQNNKELKETQELLVKSEKMASLGIMAAGVGHEINNPLNFIKNGVEALQTQLEIKGTNDELELDQFFNIINEGVKRATNIVKSLSHFSRKGAHTHEHCNMNEIIENCLLILHNKIKDKIRIVTNFDGNADIMGNEGRLHQAVMNIIANAEQAIEDYGTIVINTKRTPHNLIVSILDDGVGIPSEFLSKISDPFFTTKPPGKGTGLGLSITFSIIEEHNGKINVMSDPGNGTKFVIELPVNQPAV